jgi:hypothetical protein
MKYFLFIFLNSFLLNAQVVTNEITENAKKEKLFEKKTDLKDTKEENIIDFFYKNLDDVRKIDNVLSFRFYQKTPYNKFKEIMENKNNRFGKMLEKKILKIEYSKDKMKVIFLLEVKYLNETTKEQILMIKESVTDNYSIIEYVVM